MVTKSRNSDLAETPTGTRAAKKAATRARISRAAWELFTEVGYDKATTKAVASRAGVASGTVFVHASDKEDLLFLVMHDRLEAVAVERFGTLPGTAPLLDQLVHVFAGFFSLYGEHPGVARAFIKSFPPSSRGPNGKRLEEMTLTFIQRLAGLLADAQARGEVAAQVLPLRAAQNCFALYLGSLMTWLSGYATLEIALDPHLRSALALQIRGLRP